MEHDPWGAAVRLAPDSVLTVRLYGSDAERIVNLLKALLDMPHSLTRQGEQRIERTLAAFKAAVIAAQGEQDEA